jgi:serine/alanine adding enzyme
MMIDVKLLTSSDSKDISEWQQLCNSNPNCDINFYPQYAQIYEQNNEGEACCFVTQKSRNDFIIYPFLKRKINQLDLYKSLSEDFWDITSPYGYGGYLRNKNCSIDMKEFFRIFQNYCKEHNIISEFVRFNPWLKTEDSCNEFLEVSLWNQVVAIELTKSEQEIWAEFDSKNRNRIRKSRKCGVVIKQDLDFTFIEDFCQLYNQTMDRKDALNYYYYDKHFFLNMISLLSGNIALFNAFYDNKIIASLIVLYANDFAHAHLSCADAENLNLAPYNILFYEVALWGKKEGFKYFILGGGTTSEADDSLLRFKKRFSKNYFDFYVGKKIHNKEIYELLCQKKLQHEKDKQLAIVNENFFPFYRR